MATPRTDRLVVLDHPLVQHKLALLRDAETNTKDFRHLMGELAAFLCYEATRDLELEKFDVQHTTRGDAGAGASPARSSASWSCCARAWACSTPCST